MASGALTDEFIGALARRRATGEAVDAPACADACVARLVAWGAQRVLVPDEPLIGGLGLPGAIAAAGLEVITWPAGREWRELLGLDGAPATCAVTAPRAGVAQRGTLVIAGAPTHGRSMDAVGWWHLAVLPEERIVATLAQALQATYAPGERPASGVSLVSGPSRTSDVEKITTYGAHGALAEHVVVVRSSPSG
jgi:L-lactate dehydrogenase complex protein LldG